MERERSESHGVRIYTGSLFLLLSESSGAVLLIFTAKAKHSDWKKMVGGQPGSFFMLLLSFIHDGFGNVNK